MDSSGDGDDGAFQTAKHADTPYLVAVDEFIHAGQVTTRVNP